MGVKALLLRDLGCELEEQWTNERDYTTNVVRGAKAEAGLPRVHRAQGPACSEHGRAGAARVPGRGPQLLDLMIHSLYSHKDIFLRELISNASDALDKLRFEAVTQPGARRRRASSRSASRPTRRRARSPSCDNGIGMSRDEVVENIGTIARSGTREFLQRRARAARARLPPELIGQFGVGFYSSFMVADRVGS